MKNTCPSDLIGKNVQLIFASFVLSFLASMISYLFIEKPAIDARVAFKEIEEDPKGIQESLIE